MSLTNVYYLHQKTGTDLSGATHRYLSNERQLQVGPVDLPAQGRDGLRKGRIVIFVLRSTNHLYKKVFSRLCALNICVHIDLPPAFVVACVRHTSIRICIIHLKMCILLLILHASVCICVHRTSIHMFADVSNSVKHCIIFPSLLCTYILSHTYCIRGGLGLTNDLAIYIFNQLLTPKLLQWSELEP